MFLRRHNLRYAGVTAWSVAHLRFLATAKRPSAEQQWIFQEVVQVITEADERLARNENKAPPWWRAGGGSRWSKPS